MSLPVMPPATEDSATAPTVQVWRLERATAAPTRPSESEAPPTAATAVSPPPCDPPPVTVTPATAPTIQAGRDTSRSLGRSTARSVVSTPGPTG